MGVSRVQPHEANSPLLQPPHNGPAGAPVLSTDGDEGRRENVGFVKGYTHVQPQRRPFSTRHAADG